MSDASHFFVSTRTGRSVLLTQPFSKKRFSLQTVFRTPEFERLFILAEIGKFTPEQYEQYQKSLKIMSDYYNIIDTATEEAEKRGRAEGVNEAKLETAKNLKSLGVAEYLIVQATGLPVETVQTL